MTCSAATWTWRRSAITRPRCERLRRTNFDVLQNRAVCRDRIERATAYRHGATGVRDEPGRAVRERRRARRMAKTGDRRPAGAGEPDTHAVRSVLHPRVFRGSEDDERPVDGPVHRDAARDR